MTFTLRTQLSMTLTIYITVKIIYTRSPGPDDEITQWTKLHFWDTDGEDGKMAECLMNIIVKAMSNSRFCFLYRWNLSPQIFHLPKNILVTTSWQQATWWLHPVVMVERQANGLWFDDDLSIGFIVCVHDSKRSDRFGSHTENIQTFEIHICCNQQLLRIWSQSMSQPSLLFQISGIEMIESY